MRERLSVIEQQVERGETPQPRHLAVLLLPIRLHRSVAPDSSHMTRQFLLRNSDGLSRVLEVVRRSKVTLDESLGSALVSSLAEGGRVSEVREVVHQLQGRLRLQSQSSVLAMACREGDPGLAMEFLAGRRSAQPLADSLVELLVALSRQTQEPQLVEQLLSVVRETRQSLSEEGVAQLKLWAER